MKAQSCARPVIANAQPETIQKRKSWNFAGQKSGAIGRMAVRFFIQYPMISSLFLKPPDLSSNHRSSSICNTKTIYFACL